MYKLDLHTHSIASPDGSLTLSDYQKILESNSLSYIAVTDHNTLDFASKAADKLGSRIIVGEEIMTSDGEIIGLYLNKPIPAGLSAQTAMERIRAQGGLVYIPHPFLKKRHGLTQAILDSVQEHIDIMEVFNGRAILQNKSLSAKKWAETHNIAGASSSDAHGLHGWGRTYTLVDKAPTLHNLKDILKTADQHQQKVGVIGAMYPKANRFKKRKADT
jgi:predicted metal-dependent phosphoesterase TrpH